MTACKKSDDSEASSPGNTNSIGPVPATFTQKVLVEQFTGAWNGGCPDGIYRMDKLVGGNNGNVIGINVHMGDAMEIPLFNDFMATFNNNNLPQFPSAMVNRIPSLGNVFLSKTQWASNVSVDLAHTASCGLALKTITTGNTVSAEIHCGFKTALTGTYHLTVYLVSDEITGTGSAYDQVNTNTSNDPNSPYYNKPNPITGFVHNNVVIKAISASLGDPVNAAAGESIKNYSIDITGKDVAKLSLVAFINKIGNDATSHEVMNVQQVSLNSTKNWD